MILGGLLDNTMEDFKKFFSHLKYLTGQLFLITVVRE